MLYKYFDDQGGSPAALIAYYAFVSLFPLLLLLSTILGLVLAGHPTWGYLARVGGSSAYERRRNPTRALRCPDGARPGFQNPSSDPPAWLCRGLPPGVVRAWCIR